jgi:hypothetical protein
VKAALDDIREDQVGARQPQCFGQAPACISVESPLRYQGKHDFAGSWVWGLGCVQQVGGRAGRGEG